MSAGTTKGDAARRVGGRPSGTRHGRGIAMVMATSAAWPSVVTAAETSRMVATGGTGFLVAGVVSNALAGAWLGAIAAGRVMRSGEGEPGRGRATLACCCVAAGSIPAVAFATATWWTGSVDGTMAAVIASVVVAAAIVHAWRFQREAPEGCGRRPGIHREDAPTP